MYCVIQEIENKKNTYQSTSKQIEVYETTYTINGITRTSYGFQYSKEKFERPIRKAYKISIHESYRRGGKVTKKQWVICTMGYYSLLNSWPGDCIIRKVLEKKLKEMNISEEALWDMVYKKLNPLIEKVKAEFEQTDEYSAQQKQEQLIDKHHNAKSKFEKKYGEDTYKYCYDVFGVLRNEEYLNELKASYEAQQQYKSSYQGYTSSNYSSNSYSSYQAFFGGTYTEEEKKVAEEIIAAGYKQLSKKYHPDVGGTNEQFQVLGSAKEKLLKMHKK